MFIKLHEYYYKPASGEYSIRPVAINVSDISSVFETEEKQFDAVRICLKTGRYHDVEESFKFILNLITKYA